MRFRLRDAAALAAMTILAGPVVARQTAALQQRIQFETNPRVACHWYLKTFGKRSIKPDPSLKIDFGPEAALYAQAAVTIQSEAVWQWFHDLVVAGPDLGAIREAATALPEALDSPRARAGVDALIGAYTSAYPKFVETVWVEQQKELSPFLVTTRRRFHAVEQRVSEDLMKKMAFMAIDAPITIFTVLRGGGESVWGKTAAGYYLVIGQAGLSSTSLLESGLHQATHLIDSLQPFDSRSVLKQLREQLGPGAAEAVTTFLHGLITYNAGALVSRFIERDYVPVEVRAPGSGEAFRPYLSTYEFIWSDYLEGKIPAAAIVPKLVEEFGAVRKLQEAQK